MKKTLLFILFFPFSLFAQTFTSSTLVHIPDNGPHVYDTLIVSGLPTAIDSTFGLAGLCFDINHTYDADLVIRLISPNGNSLFLADRVGGGFNNFIGTCLAQNGINGYLANGSAPFTGIYIPLESLNNLNNGQDPNGIWLFEVEDVASQDSGDITNFSLTFSNNPPSNPGPPPILCSFCDCPGGITPCDLLPDMTASALSISKNINSITHHSAFEVPGNLNFDNATPNIGWGPIEIIGVDSCYCGTTLVPCTTSICPNGDQVKQVVHQVVYHKPNSSDSLTKYERSAGFMSYHPSHGHIHVDHWGDFTLRTATANPDATTWPVVGTGNKISFCLVNLGTCDGQPGYCVDTSGTVLTNSAIPNAGFGFYTGCGDHQGIYVGSLDIYTTSLNTGIDLTGVCNGNYYIVSITDSQNNFIETNELNNWTAVPVTLWKQDPTANFVVKSKQLLQVKDSATNLINVTSYTWDFGDGSPLVANTNPVTHTFPAPGTYAVTLTVYSPCGIGTFIKTDSVTVTTTGINSLTTNDVLMTATPNPASDVIEVNYKLPQSAFTTIELFDITGKRISIFVNGKETQGLHSFKINVQDNEIRKGTYLLQLISGESRFVQKIEIQ